MKRSSPQIDKLSDRMRLPKQMECKTFVPALVAPERPATQPSLTKILERLAVGDETALADLYDATADDLYGLALWTCGSAADAADAVHNVFVRLLERRELLENIRKPRSYLLRAARSASIDIVRRRRGENLDEDLLEPLHTDPSAKLDAERASTLLGRLPLPQRQALYLRFFAALTFKEIGRVCGVSTFTASSRCRLALRRLRGWLENPGEDR